MVPLNDGELHKWVSEWDISDSDHCQNGKKQNKMKTVALRQQENLVAAWPWDQRRFSEEGTFKGSSEGQAEPPRQRQVCGTRAGQHFREGLSCLTKQQKKLRWENRGKVRRVMHSQEGERGKTRLRWSLLFWKTFFLGILTGKPTLLPDQGLGNFPIRSQRANIEDHVHMVGYIYISLFFKTTFWPCKMLLGSQVAGWLFSVGLDLLTPVLMDCVFPLTGMCIFKPFTFPLCFGSQEAHNWSVSHFISCGGL